MQEHIGSNPFKINNDVVKFSIAPVVYMLLIVAAKLDTFNLVYRIQEYNRGVGITAVSNYDIDRFVQNVYFTMLILIPGICVITFCVVGLIVNAIIKKYGNENASLKFLNFVSTVTSISLFIEIASKYGTDQTIHEIYTVIMYILIAGYLSILFNKNEVKEIDDLKWSMVIGSTGAIFLQIVAERLVIEMPIYLPWIVSCLFVCILESIFIISVQIKRATSVFAFWSGAIGIMLEGIIILNQREIYVTRIYLMIILLTVIFLMFVGGLWYFNIKFDSGECINYGLIFSTTVWTGLPLVQSVVETDFFEQANYAVSFSQLVLGGKIPIVESVSAHLASDWIPNILYYVLNRDYVGSLFSPYQYGCFIIWILLFYIVLKQCMKKDYALIVCLLLPFVSNEMGWGGLALLPLIGLIVVGKKESNLNFFFFWLLIALGVLYKADTGISIGVACVVSYFVVKLLKKETIPWVKGCVTFSLVVVLFVLALIITCVVKDIDIVRRVIEFLKIFGGSNEIWAYGNLGVEGNFEFAFVYFAMPLLVVVLLLLLCLRVKMQVGNINKAYLLCTYTFGIAYLVNLQRIIVRHNYLELGFSIRLVFTAAVFVSLFFMGINKIYANYLFVAVLSFFIILFSFDDAKIQNANLISSSCDQFDNGKIVSKYGFNDKIERVVVGERMKNTYEKVVERINWLLSDEETFFDFSNQSLLYSLSQKVSPVYIVQSPSQIASEDGQDMFLEELVDAKVPIAVSTIDHTLNCGTGVDGMMHSYRFYKVSEYLNANYYPIESIGSFTLWVEKERIDLVEKIISDYDYVQLSDELECNDMTYKQDNDSILLIGTGMDPYIENIYVDVSKIEEDNYILSMLYEASSPCTVQVYYKTDRFDGYCEAQSVVKPLSYSGQVNFELPKDAQWIRIDIPQDVTVLMEQISYNEKDCSLSGMYYGDENDLHNYNLGQIPYLWANYDYKNAINNKVIKNFEDINVGKFDVSINDESDVYVKVTLCSDYSSIASIKLVKGLRENTSFNFTTIKGENTYLIRVSADSYWNSEYTDSIMFQAGEECQLKAIDLISVEDKNSEVK